MAKTVIGYSNAGFALLSFALLFGQCHYTFGMQQQSGDEANCAPGAVYCFLLSQGIDIPLDDVIASFQAETRNSSNETALQSASLQCVCKVLKGYGFSAIAVQYDDFTTVKPSDTPILLTHPPKLNGVGHFVFLSERKKDGFTIVDPTNETSVQFVTNSKMETAWRGYAIRISRRTNFLWVVALGGVLLALLFCGRKRMNPRSLKLLPIAMVGIFVGCRDHPIGDLSFADSHVQLTDLRRGAKSTFQLPFVVTSASPVVIKSLTASCNCVTFDEKQTGIRLSPNSDGSLRIVIDPQNRQYVSAGLLVSTDSGFSKRISIEGAVESPPEIASMPIYCVYQEKGELPSGQIIVRRIRSIGATRLEPEKDSFEGQNIRLELNKSEVISMDSAPVEVDQLMWTWYATTDSVPSRPETVEIKWRESTSKLLKKSDVSFVFSKQFQIQGLVENLALEETEVGRETATTLNLFCASAIPKLNVKPSTGHGINASLIPSESRECCSLVVRWTPVEAGPLNAKLVLEIGDSEEFVIAVTGSAIAP